MNSVEIFEYWMEHTQIYLKKIYGNRFPDISKDERDLIQKSCLFYRQDLFSKVNCNEVNANNVDNSGEPPSKESTQLSPSAITEGANTIKRATFRSLFHNPISILKLINFNRLPPWTKTKRYFQLVKDSFTVRKQQVVSERKITDVEKASLKQKVEQIKYDDFLPSGQKMDAEEYESIKDTLAGALGVMKFDTYFTTEADEELLGDIQKYASEGGSKDLTYNAGNNEIVVTEANGDSVKFGNLLIMAMVYAKGMKNNSNWDLDRSKLAQQAAVRSDINALASDYMDQKVTDYTTKTPNEEGSLVAVKMRGVVTSITSHAMRFFHNKSASVNREVFHKQGKIKDALHKDQTNRGLNMAEVASMHDLYDEDGNFIGTPLTESFYQTYVPHVKKTPYIYDIHGSEAVHDEKHQSDLIAAMSIDLLLKERRDSFVVDFYNDQVVIDALSDSSLRIGNLFKERLKQKIENPETTLDLIETKVNETTGAKQQHLIFGVGAAGHIAAVFNNITSEKRIELVAKYPYIFPNINIGTEENPIIEPSIIHTDGTFRGKQNESLEKATPDLINTGPYKNFSTNVRDGTLPVLDSKLFSRNEKGEEVVKDNPGYKKELANPLVERMEELEIGIQEVKNKDGSIKTPRVYGIKETIDFFEKPGGAGGGYLDPEKSEIFANYLWKFSEWQVEGAKFMGKVPYYFEDHHQIPVDDLGDNNIGNFVLMRLDFHRAVGHATHKLSFSDNGMQATKKVIDESDLINVNLYDSENKLLDEPEIVDVSPDSEDNKFQSSMAVNFEEGVVEEDNNKGYTFEDNSDNPRGQQPLDPFGKDVNEGDVGTIMLVINSGGSRSHMDYDPKHPNRTLDRDICPPVHGYSRDEYRDLLGKAEKKKAKK